MVTKNLPTARRWPSIVLGLVAVACIAARVAWEIRAPLHFDTVKTWIYVRDVVTLGPATAAALAAVWFAPRWEPRWLERPSRRAVVAVAALAFVLCFAVAKIVLLATPAIVDEAAYLYQAQLLLDGRLAGLTGPEPTSTLVQYVGDLGDKRVSVFFPGSAIPLAVGYLFHAVAAVDPFLVALLCLITYWAGARLYSRRVGLIAAIFFALSPFTIFQGASFFGQVWTGILLVPAAVFALAPKRRFEPVAIGALVAFALLTRPASAAAAAVAIGLLWVGHAIQHRDVRSLLVRAVMAIAGGAVPIALFLGYNYALTGNAFETAHRLLLPNETLQLSLVWVKNVALNIAGLAVDFNGLVLFGLGLVVVALVVRDRTAALVVGYAAIHLAGYGLYYNHGISYGPRYLFEVSPLLLVVGSYGLTRVSRLDARVPAVLVVAAIISLAGALPGRAPVFHDRAKYLDLAPVSAELANTWSIVFVTRGPYAFPDPFYPAFAANGANPGGTPVVYVRDDPSRRCELVQAFGNRSAFTLDADMRARGVSAVGALRPISPCASAG